MLRHFELQNSKRYTPLVLFVCAQIHAILRQCVSGCRRIHCRVYKYICLYVHVNVYEHNETLTPQTPEKTTQELHYSNMAGINVSYYVSRMDYN